MEVNNSSKVILHLCASHFGSDSKPYREAGYDVRLITKEIGVENYHPPESVYGVIANPPCTKFSRAGWQIAKIDRDFNEGMRLVKECLRIIWEVQERGAQLKFWVLENPYGYLPQFLGHPVMVYQPWQFGETGTLATKKEALWGYFKKPEPIVFTRPVKPVQKASTYKKMLFPDLATRNPDWSNLSSDERSIASPYFTKAFFKANP